MLVTQELLGLGEACTEAVRDQTQRSCRSLRGHDPGSTT